MMRVFIADDEEIIRDGIRNCIEKEQERFLFAGEAPDGEMALPMLMEMKPDVLILDEPTAGLDPKGRDDILDCVKKLQKETGITVILVSHSMEDVAKYVDRIMVMNDGILMYNGTPKEVFAHYKELEKIGLAAPQVTYIMNDLKNAGFDVDVSAITIEEAKTSILKALGKK